MAKIKAVLMDLDGTVYRGNEAIDGARHAIEQIRSRGIRLFFFTNNSAKTRRQLAAKLDDMGIACGEDDMITSGFITAYILRRKEISDAYVCGTSMLKEELKGQGINNSTSPESKVMVIGFDPEFDYRRLKEAVNIALRSDLIVACNQERTFPCGEGLLCPGCGAIVSSIEYCIGRDVDLTVGKPNRHMFDYVLEMTGVGSDEVLVVGDSYESDICMANDCSARSVLIGKPVNGCDAVPSVAQITDHLD